MRSCSKDGEVESRSHDIVLDDALVVHTTNEDLIPSQIYQKGRTVWTLEVFIAQLHSPRWSDDVFFACPCPGGPARLQSKHSPSTLKSTRSSRNPGCHRRGKTSFGGETSHNPPGRRLECSSLSHVLRHTNYTLLQ